LSSPTPLTPTPVAYDAFVQAFPEFDNAVLFPQTCFNFWASIAVQMLNQQRWGNQFQYAQMLFIAHNLALEALAMAGAPDGIPGLSRGVVSAEAGGSASASYDVAAATEKDASHWNLTIYGLRIKYMISMFGAGPVYIGPGWGPNPTVALGAFRGGTACGAGPGWGFYDRTQ